MASFCVSFMSDLVVVWSRALCLTSEKSMHSLNHPTATLDKTSSSNDTHSMNINSNGNIDNKHKSSNRIRQEQ